MLSRFTVRVPTIAFNSRWQKAVFRFQEGGGAWAFPGPLSCPILGASQAWRWSASLVFMLEDSNCVQTKYGSLSKAGEPWERKLPGLESVGQWAGTCFQDLLTWQRVYDSSKSWAVVWHWPSCRTFLISYSLSEISCMFTNLPSQTHLLRTSVLTPDTMLHSPDFSRESYYWP